MVDESKMVVKLIHGLRKLSPFRAATTDSGASVEGLTLTEAASLLILMVLIGLFLQVLSIDNYDLVRHEFAEK